MGAKSIKILIVPLILLLLPLSSVGFMLLFDFKDVSEIQPFIPIEKIGVIFLKASVIITIFYFVVKWLNTKLPWNSKWCNPKSSHPCAKGIIYKKWIWRLLVDISIVLIMAYLGISLILYLEKLQIIPVGFHKHREMLYVIPVMMYTLYIVMIEMILAIEEKNKLALRLEKMEKMHLRSEYGALKAQLDHHFLFNNLSVLSSIIYEDVNKADKFIQKFSAVYRYVLSLNKRDVVLLQEEVDFIKSYLQLYKFRFEEGFNYSIKIDDSCLKMLIAPLTLQLLVENAIKHNQASQKQPLEVTIFTENDTLIIQNNLQLRTGEVQSTQTGINNIKEKYKLLKQKAPEFVNEDPYYTVKIQLISENYG
jgi:sensor histidine kinase YesM